MRPSAEEDRPVLELAAEHRFLLIEHVQAALALDRAAAARRLSALVEGGLIAAWEDPGLPATRFRITRAGLSAIGSDLRAPRRDTRQLLHDAGIVWVDLAARAGAFGRCTAIVSERRMRSHDARAAARPAACPDRYGVRVGGVAANGRERLHYPDLLLVDVAGRRIAVELELTTKPRWRREHIFAAYASAPEIDAVLYLVDTPSRGRALRADAAAFGIADRIHVQLVRWPERSSGPDAARTATRAGARAEELQPDRAASEAER